MNPMDHVRTRRLTAMLEEALGGGAPAALADKIASRLRDRPAPRRHWLPAAALMAIGIAVVVAAGFLRHTSDRRAAQDPQPEATVVTITTAMVREVHEPIVEPPPGPALDRLLAIAGRAKVPLVATEAVTGDSKCSLADCDWRQAVERIAVEVGVGVGMFGDVVVVGLRPPLEPTTLPRLVFEHAPLHEVLGALGKLPGLGLVFAADEQGRVEGASVVRVTLDVADVSPRALLDVLASKAGLEVVPVGRVMAVRRAGPGQQPQRLALQFRERAITDVFDTWAKLTMRNVVIDSAVQGKVSVRAVQIVETDLRMALTAAVGAEVEELDRGILRIIPRHRVPAPNRIVLASQGVAVADAVQVLGLTSEQCEVVPDAGRVSIFVHQTLPDMRDLLRALAIASGRTLVRRGDHHVIE